MRFPILFSALAASTCLASCMDDVTDDQLGTDEHALTQLSDFGYGRMAALGGRPTYVVRVDYPGIANSPVTLTKTAATNLFYGDPQNPATPSVDGYYREMSNGLFWLVPKADEYISTLAPNSDPRVERLQIKAELFRRHPEIANLDTNQDGMVGRGEIAIFVIDNRGNTGQSDGGDDCVTQPGVTVKLCAPVARAGMQANLATIAHEGIHVNAGNLGAHDLYGAKMGLNNQNLSLMGPTWGGLFHLDPYTKLALGWIQPTVVSLRSGGSATVMPPTATTTQPEAVLLWDPSRGPDEYYLAEFRRPDANTYDRNTAAAGLGVWHVALDPTSKRNAVGSPRRNGLVSATQPDTYSWNIDANVPVTIDLAGAPEVTVAVTPSNWTSPVCQAGGLSRAKQCTFTLTAASAVQVQVATTGVAKAAYNLRVALGDADGYVYAMSPASGTYGGTAYWPAGTPTHELHWLDGSEAGIRLSATAPDSTSTSTISWTRTLPPNVFAPSGTTALSDNMIGQTAVDTGARLVVFERDGQSLLHHRWYENGAWSPWYQLGAETISSAPSAVLVNGQPMVFARRDDGQLWQKYYDPQLGNWTGWLPLGGSITSAPAAVVVSGQPVVFARGYDGMAWRIQYDGAAGKWGAWTRVEGPVLGSAPSAAVWGTTLNLFATDTSGALLRTTAPIATAAFTGWSPVGVQLSSAPSAVVAGTRLVVFGRDLDGSLKHLFYENGSQSGWLSVTTGTTDSSPSATVTASGRLVVFASVASSVQQTYWDSQWINWADLR